jgi:hypothetical protein
MQGGIVTPEALKLAVLEAGIEIVSDINKSLGKRLDETNAHLRTLNGRVGKVEVKTRNLEREVFGRRSTDRQPEVDEERRPLTRRDAQMVIAGITGTLAVLAFVTKLLPMLLKAVTP